MNPVLTTDDLNPLRDLLRTLEIPEAAVELITANIPTIDPCDIDKEGLSPKEVSEYEYECHLLESIANWLEREKKLNDNEMSKSKGRSLIKELGECLPEGPSGIGTNSPGIPMENFLEIFKNRPKPKPKSPKKKKKVYHIPINAMP